MRKAIFKNDPDFGIIYVHSVEADCLVEYQDGTLNFAKFYDLKFIDSPESEQRAEFAKAAMQALISRPQGNCDPSTCIKYADALIAELNKQKP